MLKTSTKTSLLSLVLLTSSQFTCATHKAEPKKNICSYLSSACQRVFSCLKKKSKPTASEERLLKRKNSLPQITMVEYQNHQNSEEKWILIAGKIYDVTHFIDEHPGGGEHITKLFGRDATKDFEDFSHSEEMFEEYGVKAVASLVD